MKLIALVSLMMFSALSFAQDLKGLELPLCEAIAQKSKMMNQEECVEMIEMELDCFTDRCFHNMNNGDLSFNLKGESASFTGQVEIARDDSLNLETLRIWND